MGQLSTRRQMDLITSCKLSGDQRSLDQVHPTNRSKARFRAPFERIGRVRPCSVPWFHVPQMVLLRRVRGLDGETKIRFRTACSVELDFGLKVDQDLSLEDDFAL